MVHQYQLNGYNIVLDSCSGSVHVVDDVAYDVIAMYKDTLPTRSWPPCWQSMPTADVTEADLRQCLEDVALWKPPASCGLPTSTRTWRSTSRTARRWSRRSASVAHTCNLNCSYCFASQGRYQGDRALMSFEVGKRAMDFLIENSGTRRNLESISSAVSL
ncbi:MAG: hypothetical protein ACLVA8_07095 [Faecalibacterium prausnitzii]